MTSTKKKVVLAYSGGLDTTYCALHLSKDLGMKVYTVLGNTGGFSDEELCAIEKKTQKLGVIDHTSIDLTEEYYAKCIKYLIMGNVLKNNCYPLSVSSERAFQAMAIAKCAHEIGADYIAHGSTGAGNDQIRFDLIFQIMAPNAKIITPTRDLELSREEEIEYLKEAGIDDEFEKMAYSINAGIWGTSIGGKETLNSSEPLPEEAYPKQVVKTESEKLSIGFEAGELVSVNDEKLSPLEAIKKIEAIGSQFGIGRDMHIGDTILGTKGRVAFEAAAPVLILKAHEMLEKHCLSKWQMHWKDQLGDFYGMLLHEAQYLEPLMRNMETFLVDTQKKVTGTATLKLSPKYFQVEGITSPNDLMTDLFGQYGETNVGWTADDVKGFTNILANSLKIYYTVNQE
ncbi:argininosuccinate synthase [Labilibaculum sp. DW002]|uniref:argininosuccinate synthase n=1 Tax=Paralabilibaculum antarcticum TaxID=2912572 RepID=A0ABT5VMM5_9BACT|nr:argininosuccinate synthase domain-containing protein [Labilibaculum sp. DW002]MDE5416692.1 argininosuccinate synthase [Labilibaculum sp. DW002]